MDLHRTAGFLLLATAALALAQRLEDTELLPLDHKAILYWGTPAGDAVSRLQERIDKGEARLEYQPGNLGYLPSVLKLLEINPDSQVLVFSRNSAQSPRISPQSPRAIYFNDDVAVGFVQGAKNSNSRRWIQRKESGFTPSNPAGRSNRSWGFIRIACSVIRVRRRSPCRA